MGDSLSAAYGIPLQRGWVALLAERLQKEGSRVRVVNASISGETTQGGLTRLPAELARTKPAVVILELGANDGLRGQSLDAMRDNLRQMIALSRKAGAKVLVLGMRIPPNYGPQYGEQFFHSFDAVASEARVPVVRFFLEKVALRPELIQADGLHPTTVAQPLLVETVWPALKPLLPR
jgi:acyl-CoA thioesterase-1